MKPLRWDPPAGWVRITTIDAHAEGEPLRVVTGGLPEIPGGTMVARRRRAMETIDGLRRAILWEPRGHADMYGAILTPPVTPGADLGVLFLHNQGFSTMCGHGIIALTTVALETGILPAREPETAIRIDTPAGPVAARAAVSAGRVRGVSFRNVPSFVLALDEEVEVPGLGPVRYDLAFGGAFYAYVRAGDARVRCAPDDYRRIIDRGIAVKKAVAAARPVPHPFEEDLSFLYGVVFVGPAGAPGAHSRNVCVFADGEVDRSPTGTSVSARLAIHHARGEVAPGETMVFESLIGTRFAGRIVETAAFGPHDAVIPEVEGTARITGRHEFLIDPEDPLKDGFLLR